MEVSVFISWKGIYGLGALGAKNSSFLYFRYSLGWGYEAFQRIFQVFFPLACVKRTENTRTWIVQISSFSIKHYGFCIIVRAGNIVSP